MHTGVAACCAFVHMTTDTPPPQAKGRGGLMALLIAIAILVGGYFGIDLSGILDPQATVVPATAAATAGATAPPTAPVDWYEVYFTNPTCPPANERIGGIDETVAADIRAAQRQVDVAAFDLEAPPVLDALIAAHGRGVIVRAVVDDGQTPAADTARLRRAGISVTEDQRSGFMHNKFVVIDERIVWTGSMNLSPGDVYCYNNNFVRLESDDLAANYTAEFNEMFVNRQFGPTSPRNTQSAFIIHGVRVENHFASEGNVASNIARVIARSDHEILFMAFSFTNEDIGEAILERAQNGSTVRGVFETTGSTAAGSYYNDFRRARLDNLQVRQDGNPRLMHHKVIILDRSIVVFGSFNFSNNANNQNDENVLIVYDPTFAQYFVEEFELVWSEARPPR